MTEREVTGATLAAEGVPEGWLIDRRRADRDVYILVPDTPVAHARRKLAEVRRLADEALLALEEVRSDGAW